MTFNIFWGGQDHDPAYGRDHEWLELIKGRNPDVILIQEANAWLPAEEDHLAAYVDSLNNAFPDDPPFSGFIGEAGKGFHVVIISRIPIVAFETFRVVDVGLEVVHIFHVFTHVTLDLWGTPGHVVNVHFKPGWYSREDREKEARALLAILDGLPVGEPVWIGGDFNSYSPVDVAEGSPTPPDYAGGAPPAEIAGWEPMGYLLERGYTDAFRTWHPLEFGYTKETAAFLPNTNGPIERVDFLLRSPDEGWYLTFAEVAADSLGHIASDHYAVLARYVDEPPLAVEPDIATPGPYDLRLWPNPAVGASHISYALPRSGRVRLRIYGSDGRLIRSLVDGRQEAGSHALDWDGTDRAGRPLPEGVYFVNLDDQHNRKTRRIIKVGMGTSR